MIKATPYYPKVIDALWAAVLISLPVTSFPLFTRLTNSLVAPLAGLPAFLLCLAWLVPYLWRRGQLPIEVKPLLIFGGVSLVASAGAFFIRIPVFKEASVFGQELRAYFTLAIGGAFFLLASTVPRSARALHQSLRWISLGGLFMLLWNLAQVVYLLTGAQEYPGWVTALHRIFITETGFFFRMANRLSGLTYEPSWFTYQMTLTYFPLWVSASLMRRSVFKFKLRGLILEDGLLVLAMLEFLLSAPRISLLSLLIIGLLAAVTIHRKLVNRITIKLEARQKGQNDAIPPAASQPNKTSPNSSGRTAMRLFIRIAVSGGLLLGYLGIGSSTATFLLQRDDRIQRLFALKTTSQEIANLLLLDENTWLRVSLRLAFFERVNYWFFGLHVFEHYPWLGVGLGNAGFFYLEELPAPGWGSWESRGLTYSISSLPNVKNLWVRLLAESGLAGFAAFCFWLFVLWRSTRSLSRSKLPEYEQIALFGSLSLAALLPEGFSIDSFALPFLWVTAGLISAAAMTFRKGKTASDQDSPTLGS